MEYVKLGDTDIEVSRICFGTLTVGPLQAGLPLREGADVLAYGVERGINFFDTAQLYETYPYIRRAMEQSGRWDLVISTKTYAYTRKLAAEAVEEARKALNRDYIDIFMLHEQESLSTLKGHREALEYLLECREKGVIRAVGASMHHVAAVCGAMELALDVIHPLLNCGGLGIVDGTREDMERILKQAHGQGIGIFSMKPLGGGNLFKQAAECLSYIRGLPFVDSVAIGMQHPSEIDANLEFFAAGAFSKKAASTLSKRTRRLHIDDWCVGCGRCVKRCSQAALHLEEGKAECDHSRCILCGYCCKICPEWAIKVV